MPGQEILNKVDTNKDFNITQKELNDFLNNKNTKEADVKAVAEVLNKDNQRLMVMVENVLQNSHADVVDKIKRGEILSKTEILNFKLWLYLVENKTNIDFTSKGDRKEIYVDVMKINPVYKATTFQKKSEPSIVSMEHPINKEKIIGNIKLPIIRDPENSQGAIKNLIVWIKTYDFPGYEKARLNSQEKNHHKDAKYMQSYIDYDLAVFAFQKYQKIVTGEIYKAVKQAGYTSPQEYEKQLGEIQKVSKDIEHMKAEKYSDIDKIMQDMIQYQKDLFDIANKHGFENTQKREQTQKSYLLYQGEMEKMIKENNYDVALTHLKNPKITNEKDVKQYLADMNSMQQYKTKVDELQKKYGKAKLLSYEKFLTDTNTVIQRYGREKILGWSQKLQQYQQSVEGIKKNAAATIDRKKYDAFNSLVAKSGLAKYENSLTILQNILAQPGSEKSPFLGIAKDIQEQKIQQAETDATWATFKTMDPMGYYGVNFLASFWNGLIDFTVGTGSALGILIMSTYKNDNELAAEIERKKSFDDALKFNVSSEMKKPPLDADGKWNLGIDNTVSMVGAQVANLLCLITGSGAISEGVATIGAKAGVNLIIKSAPKVGLFSMAMITQTGNSFVEAKEQGLADEQAFQYAMIQSLISSSLELISPNNLISGQGKNTFKALLGGLLKQGGKKEMLSVGKIIGKELGKEVLEENLQETLQLAVGNGINLRINGQWDTKFDANFSWQNFAQTALLTTLTTGIASAPGAISNAGHMEGVETQQQIELKQSIIKSPLLYAGMMTQIDDIISGKLIIQGVEMEKVIALKNELENMHSRNDVNAEQIIQDNADIHTGQNITSTPFIEILRKKDAILAKDVITLDDLNWEIREHMNFQEKRFFIEKHVHPGKELSVKELLEHLEDIHYQLIKRFTPETQWEMIQDYDLMTTHRKLARIKADLPKIFSEHLDALPVGAKIMDIGAGSQQVAINEIKNIPGKDFDTYAVDKAINPEHDLNQGLPEDFPTDCDLIYSDRTLQYVENPLNVVQDAWDHLKVGGKAVLHLGYGFSWTPEVLNQLTNLNPELNLTLVKKSNEVVGNELFIVLRKKSATDKISLPEIQSSLSNKPFYYGGAEVRWSNLYYDHKLAEDKDYMRDSVTDALKIINQIPKDFKDLAQNSEILGAEKSVVEHIKAIQNDNVRTVVAEYLLGRSLSLQERGLIINAHREMNNAKKGLQLREYFSFQEIQVLMRWGVCGEIAVETLPISRNTTKKEISEVKREHPIVVIGDLHGNYDFFVRNLKENNLIREEGGKLIWIGGDTHVQLLGDIKGDRGSQSTVIEETIENLRAQAQEQGGNIGEIVDGNHDYYFKSFLVGDQKTFEENWDNPQNAGLHVDIMAYISSNPQWQGLINIFQNSFADRQKVIEQYLRQHAMYSQGNMSLVAEIQNNDFSINIKKLSAFCREQGILHADPLLQKFFTAIDNGGGRLLINEDVMDFLMTHRADMINNMPLALRQRLSRTNVLQQRNDNLFLHITPTEAAMEIIVEYAKRNNNDVGKAIEEINAIYQEGMQFSVGLRNTNEHTEEFKRIVEIFADLNPKDKNKSTFDSYMTYLHEHGINRIFNGHNRQDTANHYNGITQYSVDVSGPNNPDLATMFIANDGQILTRYLPEDASPHLQQEVPNQEMLLRYQENFEQKIEAMGQEGEQYFKECVELTGALDGRHNTFADEHGQTINPEQINYVIFASSSMLPYLDLPKNVPESERSKYIKLPGDLDIALNWQNKGAEELVSLHNTLKKNPMISTIKLERISDNSILDSKDITTLEEYVRAGDIKITGRIGTRKFEIFPEKDGNGLTNYGYNNSYKSTSAIRLNIRDHKMNFISMTDDVDNFVLNLANEILNDNLRGYDKKTKNKSGLRFSSIHLFGQILGYDTSTEGLRKIFQETKNKFEMIPRASRSPYAKKGLKNLDRALKAIGQLQAFEERNAKYLSNTGGKLPINMFSEFHIEIKNQKKSLTALLQTYKNSHSPADKKAIEDGIRQLIYYMHNIDFDRKPNRVAYIYETYTTYKDFIFPMKTLLEIPPGDIPTALKKMEENPSNDIPDLQQFEDIIIGGTASR